MTVLSAMRVNDRMCNIRRRNCIWRDELDDDDETKLARRADAIDTTN